MGASPLLLNAELGQQSISFWAADSYKLKPLKPIQATCPGNGFESKSAVVLVEENVVGHELPFGSFTRLPSDVGLPLAG